MKKNNYTNLSDTDLEKKIKLTKLALTAFIIIYVVAFIVVLVLLSRGNFSNSSIATFMPLFFLPITLLPIGINYSLLTKEKKSRNL